jgi:ribosome maturation factor RimP
MQELQRDIQNKITDLDPEIEIVAVEKAGPETLRIYVDHPGGVDLGLCERVTKQLSDFTDDWALEVSSPGLDRPLTKLEHFERFAGSRIRVRVRRAIEDQKNFTGLLVAADEHAVSIEDESGIRVIPHEQVHRANLVPEFSEVSP